jgi:hypothetical protein
VTILEIHALFKGVPLLLVIVLVLLIYRRKGPHPATYKMSQPWQHEPILWAAVDERIGDHGHGPQELMVGGGASGKW